jgi:hypothetical protein
MWFIVPLCVFAFQVLPYGSNAADVTEADAFLAALRELPHANNTVVWGKSDELVVRIHEVRTAMMHAAGSLDVYAPAMCALAEYGLVCLCALYYSCQADRPDRGVAQHAMLLADCAQQMCNTRVLVCANVRAGWHVSDDWVHSDEGTRHTV